jgi:PAS domain S-box-containing protein
VSEARGSILVVDDEKSIRSILSRELEAIGYTCMSAASSEEALETASLHDFDIVLTDLRMPGMSGMDLLSEMTAGHPDTAVILITAVSDVETAVEAMKLGASDYVTKPFKLDDIVVRVDRALERTRLIRENRDHRLRAAEQSLQESEEEYSALVGGIADAVVKTTGGTISWCNDRVSEVLGFTKQELIGKDPSTLLADGIDPAEFSAAALAATREHNHCRDTTKVMTGSGKVVDVDFVISRMPGRKPPEFVIVMRDITESVELQEELRRLESIYDEHSHILSDFYVDLEAAKEAQRESEERFRSVAETAGDAIISTDGSGNVVFWNTAARTMFGYSASEAIAKPLTLMIPKRLRQAYQAEIDQVMTTTEPEPPRKVIELFGLKKDGSEFPMELSTATWKAKGAPFLTAVIRDITERKRSEEALQRAHDELEIRVRERTADLAKANEELQTEIGERKMAEQALKASEERYRTVFENSAVAITVTDENENIVSWNRLAEELLGMDEGDLHMRPVKSLYPEPEWRRIRAENVRQKGMQHHLETKVVRMDQEVIDVDLSISVLKDPDGNVTGSIGIMADISERKRAEEAKRRMEQQLQLAGRLAAVGELAAGVAHELNNPLAAIQGFAQLVVSRDDLDETLKGDVEIIYEQAQRATGITENLLSFARRRRPEKSLISMNEVVEKSLELEAYQMKVKGIEVIAELDPRLPMTMADSQQMQQVFINIITNAKQAVAEVEGLRQLRVETQASSEMIRVAFTDNGPGISEENVKRVFDPFYTSKEVGKGTGLGLSICFAIVEGHGGHLHVKSTPGEETTFVVEIPIAFEEQDAEAADPSPVQETPSE